MLHPSLSSSFMAELREELYLFAQVITLKNDCSEIFDIKR